MRARMQTRGSISLDDVPAHAIQYRITTRQYSQTNVDSVLEYITHLLMDCISAVKYIKTSIYPESIDPAPSLVLEWFGQFEWYFPFSHILFLPHYCGSTKSGSHTYFTCALFRAQQFFQCLLAVNVLFHQGCGSWLFYDASCYSCRSVEKY